MPEQLRCPQGHLWIPTSADQGNCPICQARDATTDPERGTSTDDNDRTLPPPRLGGSPAIPGPVGEALPSAQVAGCADGDDSSETLPPPQMLPRVAMPDWGGTLPPPASVPAPSPDPISQTIPPLSAVQATRFDETLPPAANAAGEARPIPAHDTRHRGDTQSPRRIGDLKQPSPDDTQAPDRRSDTQGGMPSNPQRTQPGLPALGCEPTPPDSIPPSDSGGGTGAGSTIPGFRVLANVGQSVTAGVPVVPGYRILGELGRGGMGVVYKALDIRLNRLVALKMILAGGHAAAEDLARFRLEAEAVARMQHLHIVQVYEINEYDGRPYFALEFVDGCPLDKQLAGTPMVPQQAAELVRQLAQGIHYAHERGIIHRDLKPPNVLLTAGGVPKIADFGLAKKLDEEQSSQTQSGTVMGTPSYMSPEQAMGKTKELGPACDIYSLGAILYDLLTARPPFKGTTVLDTLEQVRHQEPVPPSRLLSTVPVDLEVICLKCLEKDSARRYATAGALADDLGRYLAGEPILARPTPSWERAWKWARRRPAAAALIAVSSAAILGLGVGGVLYARLENRRAEEALSLQMVAETQKARAEENFAQARDAVYQLTQIGHQRLSHEPHMELVRRDILDQALRFHHRFLKSNNNDPLLRWETGRAHLRAGEIENMLARYDRAEKDYRAAQEYFVALLTENPGHRDYRQDLAAAWNDLAILFQLTNRLGEAEQAFNESLIIKEGLARDFSDPAYRRDLGNGYNNRGHLRLTRQRLTEAQVDYEQALARLERLVTEFPLRDLPQSVQSQRGGPQGEDQVRADYLGELARSYANLGTVWTAQAAAKPRGDEAARAEKAYSLAEQRWRQLASRYPDVADYARELAGIQLNRGVLRHRTGRGDDAVADYRAAADSLAKLAEQFRSVPDYRHLLANCHRNLGVLWREVNRPQEAEIAWRQALTVLATLVEESRRSRTFRRYQGQSHNELAMALALQNKHQEAQAAFEAALRLQEQLVQEAPAEADYWQDLIDSSINLTSLHQAIAPIRETEASARRLVAFQERRLKALVPTAALLADLARCEKILADVLLERKHDAEARKVLVSTVGHARQALAVSKEPAPSYRQGLSASAVALSELELAAGDHAAAAKVVRELIVTVPPDRNQEGIAAPELVAALLARCATVAEKDKELSAAQHKELQQTYGDEAMKWLRQAVDQGFKDVQLLEKTVEFAAVRSRDDFQRLVRQLRQHGSH